MYVGIDIGGTKTLVASFDDAGSIVQKVRFRTPATYRDFLDEVRKTAQGLDTHDFRAGGVGAPGRIDRENGIGLIFGNLNWKRVPLEADIEKIFACPIVVENDAKLAGLSESMLLPASARVLYVTISTGIGTALITNHTIVSELADSEGGRMLLEYHGKRVRWESFASGRAIVERFGKKAADITNETTWKRIAHDLATGFIELLAVLQPDIVVIGGSVGRYFDRFYGFLMAELNRFADPLVPIPVFQAAQRPDDAVLYGCYDLARAHHG